MKFIGDEMVGGFENRATFEELSWYFDKVDQERIEMGQLALRGARILMLRRNLSKLSSEDFDSAMKAVEGVLSLYVLEPPLTDEQRQQDNLRRRKLYEETQEAQEIQEEQEALNMGASVV